METNYNSLDREPLQNICSIMNKPVILSRVFRVNPIKNGVAVRIILD